ncbi:zinc carboxypeptidase [Saccharopolyspora sp. HNM0983]|uniref:Zinc carboxypeptidase n=1 Tax=Saccharopolyspora montiporae TaxID=2781240 RepID=A0A929BAP8_9PSEU|nr:M14 family metallopeptidase [Saccharopolyspora sp. HNM0983]MBE9374223.1 zinc carboxypeptidase [Saccharopolyspora sp. HNM0983]
MLSSRRRTALVAATACLALLPVQAGVSAAQRPDADAGPAVYAVPGTDTGTRTQIQRIGAEVLSVSGNVATVEATPQQAGQLRAAGIDLGAGTPAADTLPERGGQRAAAGDFPPGDEAYHTYDETVAELDRISTEHPDVAAKTSIGTSFEGRDIPALKISDNVQEDEGEPEVLFDCNQHAREHLTTEMCLRVAQRFTDERARPENRAAAEDRVLWVIPIVNPDGSAHDVESGQYQGWRKNRQDAGTDLNRNWGYKWGCCGGASDDPNAETYRGPEAFSAPETAALRDFIDSRVIGGEQRIKAAIDFHTYSELVLWPFGHTTDDTTEGMTQEQYDRFERVGTEMAGTNGYTPQQSSDLYITDGDVLDWMWSEHEILAYTFEMYPAESGGLDGFYPPGDVIDRETQRNDQAVDVLLREAGA